MRKKKYLKYVGILLTENSYQQLINITDKLEVTISKYVRGLLVKKLKENQKEEISEWIR